MFYLPLRGLPLLARHHSPTQGGPRYDEKAFSLFLAMLMLLSLAACGGGDDGGNSTADADDPNTLKVVQPDDPGVFQPGNNDDQDFNRLMRQMYETLFYMDENGEVQPWLATGYEWEDDTHFKVTLRDDVKFSDGSDFTAEDVIWTITYAIESALPNSHYNLVDAAECSVVDDYTCIIGLKQPCMTFAAHLCLPECGIASKAAFEAGNGDYLGASAIGTGPYKLDSYTQGDIIKMSANEYYWREGEPKTPNLEIRIVSADTTRATEARALSSDIVISPNTREFESIDATDGIHMEYGVTANTVYLLLNTAKAPMDNVKVREAFARAINVEATVQLAYGDFGSPASGIVCPAILGYDAEAYQTYYGAGHDVEGAKALLAEGGYPDGIDLEITVDNADSQRCDMAEAMQAQVLEAGINLSVNKMESAPMREYLAQGSHQMCIYGFTALTMEADGMLSQIQPGSSALARIGYDNQAFFDKYNEGAATEDREARGEIWKECLNMLMEDYTMIPLWHKSIGAAVKDNLEGFFWAKDYEEIYFQYIEKT